MDFSVHVVADGFPPELSDMLTQFSNVRVIELDNTNPRNICTRKVEALSTADSEFVAWMDADCLATGDISEYLLPTPEAIHIRLRSPAENAAVYRGKYAEGEARGAVPESVLSTWRRDVGDRETPAITTTCVANAMVFHRSHGEFIQRWHRQMLKMIPPENQGVVNRSNPAYFMTDESVLSSMLAFSSIAPPCCDYQLDKDSQAHLAHFGVNPKPWKRWTARNLRWYDDVMDTLDWVDSQGFQRPAAPWSLRRNYRLLSRIWALALQTQSNTKSAARKLVPL